jgi:hypothetical protein
MVLWHGPQALDVQPTEEPERPRAVEPARLLFDFSCRGLRERLSGLAAPAGPNVPEAVVVRADDYWLPAQRVEVGSRGERYLQFRARSRAPRLCPIDN